MFVYSVEESHISYTFVMTSLFCTTSDGDVYRSLGDLVPVPVTCGLRGFDDVFPLVPPAAILSLLYRRDGDGEDSIMQISCLAFATSLLGCEANKKSGKQLQCIRLSCHQYASVLLHFPES